MEDFKKFLFIKKGLQDVTVKGYVAGVKRMERRIGIRPTNSQLEQYIYEIYNSNYSYSHKTNQALTIEHYTEFLGNPLKFGRQRKPKAIVKDTLTEAEITKMIFCCKNLKEKTIITLLAYSGIRNKELCNLKVKDCEISGNQIHVIQGKGLKDGVSQISTACSKLLQTYIQVNNLQSEDYLFETYQGNQYTGGALRKRVKIISIRANIFRRIYPHLFRHSLAVNMLIRGADIITLKNQLRHTLLDTTLHYLNSLILSERNSYAKFEPSYL